MELEKRKWRTPIEILCDGKPSSGDTSAVRECSAPNPLRVSSNGKRPKSTVSIDTEPRSYNELRPI